MQTFTADDGETLYLHISGNGLPVLLLHGWTSSHTAFAPLQSTLESSHRVYSPDARGHGGHTLTVSPRPDVVRLARDLQNLLDYYALPKVALVGHSMGALTLWQYIRDYGCQRLSHLCLIDQSPKLVCDASWNNGIYGNFDAGHSTELMANLETDFAESVLRLIALGLNAKARESYERNSKGWQLARQSLLPLAPAPLIAIWESLVAADYREVLPQIDIPTLLVWGEKSNFYTKATAQYLLTHIRGSVLSNYEKADHCPHFQNPQRFSEELLSFLT